MKKALILFVRNPELGKVKTRIAATAGDEVALAVYYKLLEHTHLVTYPLTCSKYVFYVDGITTNDIWDKGQYHKRVQADADLGGRMQTAFSSLFLKGYQHIAIIGSDCYELTTALIEQAFNLLNANDIVIGPAKDGGYYLLAMRNSLKLIFHTIDWSTDKVLEQTLALIRENNYSYTLLPVLNDVDTAADIPGSWKKSY